MKELQELFDLYELEMRVNEKPDMELGDGESMMGTPQTGDLTHPVIQQRNQVDQAREEGAEVVDAHQSVYGEIDMGNIDSKAGIASTLGRVQDETGRRGIKVEPDKDSLLARDTKIEKELDQVTPEDLKTPMRGQVPDKYQTPEEEAAAVLSQQEEIDYNDDVAYLQKFGRA